MAFTRKIRKGNSTYLALVENKREGGKVVQKVLKYIGKEVDGEASRRVETKGIRAEAVKHYADVLVVDRVAKILGLDVLLDKEEWGKYVLALVYSHLLERPSIRKLEEWFSHTEIPELLGLVDVSTMKLYETLGDLSRKSFSAIEEGIYLKVKAYERKKSSVIVDVTDTYFEGNTQNGKSRRGKDGKVRKLVQVGLGVTEKHGFPLMMRTYDGTISNFMIFKDMFVNLVERGFKALIIDRGMGSEGNIKDALRARMSIISGLKKTPRLMEKYLKKIDREAIYRPECRVQLQNTAVYIKEFTYLRGKLIVVYNPQLEFVKREQLYQKDGTASEAKYVGYSFIYHNTHFSSHEVVRKYFDKDIIERAFKKLKGILSLRPIRVWTKDHIEGHMRICYLAYAILSLLEYYLSKKKIDLSAPELLEKLKRGYKVYLKDEKTNFSWHTTVLLEKKLYNILDYLDVVYKKG